MLLVSYQLLDWIGYDYWLLDVIGQMLTDMGVQNRVNPD